MTLKQYLRKNGITCSVAEFISVIDPCRQTVNKEFKQSPDYLNAYIDQYKERTKESEKNEDL